MKHVKPYELFESSSQLTQKQIQWLERCASVSWTLNTTTGLVDVAGDFNCFGQNLTDFRGVKFGLVKGGFYCRNNNLTSLEGAPQHVEGGFFCDNNNLTSLEGAPQHVEGDFSCADNDLTSLEGAPQHVGGGFYCSHNPVSEDVLEPIFSETKKNKIPYIQAVEDLWDSIPLDDQVLLYRPVFGWIDPTERRKLEALASVNRIKGMI
jgi:hypothetical protein